ncbi:MAG: hydrogenase nickel incorporation protein HypB [Candidatus Acetothermia bacterium]
MSEVELEDQDILSREDRAAEENRSLLVSNHVRAFDIMGATGSGKTAIIERINERLPDGLQMGAVAGDVTGSADYDRFKKAGIPAYNLNTESKCHLDAELVRKSLKALPLTELDILFVENVGNLICPANFPLGCEKEIVVVSLTEGDDMVRKQPKMFLQSSLLVINKVYLAQAVGVDPERPREDYLKINPDGDVIFTNARDGTGIDELIQALNL